MLPPQATMCWLYRQATLPASLPSDTEVDWEFFRKNIALRAWTNRILRP